MRFGDGTQWSAAMLAGRALSPEAAERSLGCRSADPFGDPAFAGAAAGPGGGSARASSTIGLVRTPTRRLPANTLAAVGSASSLGSGLYQLTPDRSWQTGAVWGSVDLANSVVWTTRMYFGASEGGADGVSFALQNTGPAALSSSVINVGALVPGSFGILFDTYGQSTDFGRFVVDGDVGNGSPEPRRDFVQLEDGTWHDVVITWDAAAKTFTYTVDGATAGAKAYDPVTALFKGDGTVWYGYWSRRRPDQPARLPRHRLHRCALAGGRRGGRPHRRHRVRRDPGGRRRRRPADRRGGIDRIEIGAGVAPGGLQVIARGTTSLVLRLRDTGEELTLTDALSSAASAIESVVFADGTVWDRAELRNLSALGGDGDDSITCSAGADRLEGGAGDDDLVGLDGDDVLLGGAGRDRLGSGSGADRLQGGPGDDTLSGGTGADTYVFTAGDGADTIDDRGDDAAGTLRIAGYALDRIRFGGHGRDLVIRFSDSTDRITVLGGLDEAGGLGSVEILADGVTLSLPEIRTRLVPEIGLTGRWLAGGAGDDTLAGGTGDDSCVFARGDGQDLIRDGIGTDTLAFAAGIRLDEVRAVDGARNLVLEIAGTGDRIDLARAAGPEMGIRRVTFADGTVWTQGALIALSRAGTGRDDVLRGGSSDDSLSGGAGDDWLIGLSGADTLDGGAGHDRLEGGTGDDTYLFAADGGHDRILDAGGTDAVVLAPASRPPTSR